MTVFQHKARLPSATRSNPRPTVAFVIKTAYTTFSNDNNKYMSCRRKQASVV